MFVARARKKEDSSEVKVGGEGGHHKHKSKSGEFKKKRVSDVFNDPTLHSGGGFPSNLIRGYLRLCLHVYALSKNPWFNGFITVCICLAGILVGIQTYPSMSDDPGIRFLDLVILIAFTVEVLVKVVAEAFAPWRYWVGDEWKWNNFDFIVVVLCMPFMPFEGGSIAVLRLVRLMRLMKLVKKLPQLQTILMGLIGGLKSVFYILLLLCLVFYLYAIAGIMAFRKNDPWHFGSVWVSMLTLFRIATLEDWTEIMYINIYGCDVYPGGYYDGAEFFTGSPNPLKGAECNTPNANGFIAPVYFITYIVIATFVGFSLFVGTITMAMTESIADMAEDTQSAEKAKRLRDAAMGKRKTVRGISREASARSLQATNKVMDAWIAGRDLKKIERMQSSLDYRFAADPRIHVRLYERLAVKCKRLRDHPKFQQFIIGVIMAASVLVGMQTYEDFSERHDSAFTWLDNIILAVFCAEYAIKQVAECFQPWLYFTDSWNNFDFLIIVGSFALGGSMITMLRLLRLLRVLKLVKSFPALQVIVVALLRATTSIGFIGILLVLVFYLFAIVGMILFEENDPWHFGSLHVAMLSLFRCATCEDWTDVMYINIYGCDQYGYRVDGDIDGCDAPKASGVLAGLFFVVFTVIGALVMLTLFVGVVTTAMDTATQEQEAATALATRMADLRTKHNILSEMFDLYSSVFKILDVDESNTISAEELAIGFEQCGKIAHPEKIRTMMSEVDTDKNGEIDQIEFMVFMAGVQKQYKEQLDADRKSVDDGEKEREARRERMMSQELGLLNLGREFPPTAAETKAAVALQSRARAQQAAARVELERMKHRHSTAAEVHEEGLKLVRLQTHKHQQVEEMPPDARLNGPAAGDKHGHLAT